MMVSGVGLVVVKVGLDTAASSVPRENLLGDERQTGASGERQHVEITGAKNILMVGLDSRPDQDQSEGVRADSIIIAHIPASHDAVYLVSIPRDTLVRIPASDNGVNEFASSHEKINEAYMRGGLGLTGAKARSSAFGLLAKTIREAYGVSFDAGAIVDFDGFRAMIEAVGGVDLDVDQETTSIHVGSKNGKFATPYRPRYSGSDELVPVPGVTPKVYHVGPQHLSPHEALDFARQRKLLPQGDYDRQRHQQQLIKAVIRQVASQDTLTNPMKLLKVLDSVGKAMTIDNGGIELEDWIFALRGIRGDDIVTIKTNNGAFHQSQQQGAEALDETTLALLRAVGDHTAAAFIASHADLVTQS
jgi:LCP family protein required for cell wall assembly